MSEVDEYATEVPDLPTIGEGIAQMLEGLARQGERYDNTRSGPRGVIPKMLRTSILMRDGFQCTWCGGTYHLQLDHVVPWSAWGPDHGGNLRTLCEWCNERRSNYVTDSEHVRIVPALTDCPCCQHKPRALHWYDDASDDRRSIWCGGCQHYCHADKGDVERVLQWWHDYAQTETR